MMQDEREEGRQERYEDVWDALEATPEVAADMRLRSDLMIRVQRQVAAWGMTQTAAAGRLGITQPRLNDLLRGKISKFSLGALVDLAARAGLQVRVEVERAAA
jgi:predicted XRE-type DNA-binding protein